jgi:hypothetical protein
VNLSNPFSHYRTNRNDTRDFNFYRSSVTEYPFRSINVGFSYRFGKLNADIKKNKRGIENDDIKGGNKSGDSGK